MENEIKVADAECFELDGQMYVSDLLGTAEDVWLSKPNTLCELEEQRKSSPLPRYFSARSMGNLYVADNNLLTIWDEADDGSCKRVAMIFWSEAGFLEEYDLLFFHYDMFIPEDVARFHNAIDMLVTLSSMSKCFSYQLAAHCLPDCDENKLATIKEHLLGNEVGEIGFYERDEN